MKTMNHAEYQQALRSKPMTSLMFIMKDAREAAEAMPDGENAGYYLDEVNYCAMEIARRQKSPTVWESLS